MRRALLASAREGEVVFEPFTGSGTTAIAAKELNRAFVGTMLEEEFAGLAAYPQLSAGACCARAPSSSGATLEFRVQERVLYPIEYRWSG